MQKSFKVGQRVAYQPHPAVSPEYGTITRISDDRMTIFVRYDGDSHSKATRPKDLT